ncbi:MAG TPA: hypothetical protein VGS20_02610 [Candidatus Acidoferrales bacterium]|nr:hypothetical protein [Candidatus Acidoferrales bacterium]
MRSPFKLFLVSLSVSLLVLAPAFSPAALADTGQREAGQHAVSSAELQQAVADSARTRQANEAAVESFLGSGRARQSLKKAGIDYQIVQRGIPLLSNDELASLAARSQAAQKQFQAGALTNQQITYIIIALATAVIIIVIVER